MAERLANAYADLHLLGKAERKRWLQKQKKRRRRDRKMKFFWEISTWSFIIFSHSEDSSLISPDGKWLLYFVFVDYFDFKSTYNN